jgi:hypothetical protein
LATSGDINLAIDIERLGDFATFASHDRGCLGMRRRRAAAMRDQRFDPDLEATRPNRRSHPVRLIILLGDVSQRPSVAVPGEDIASAQMSSADSRGAWILE